MKLEITVDEANPCLGIYLATQMLNDSQVSINWSQETKATLASNKSSVSCSTEILRMLASMSKDLLYCDTPALRTLVDHWLTFSKDSLTCPNVDSFKYLNQALATCTYFVGDRLTVADLAVYDKLSRVQKDQLKDFNHIRRWYNFIEETVKRTLPANVLSKANLQGSSNSTNAPEVNGNNSTRANNKKPPQNKNDNKKQQQAKPNEGGTGRKAEGTFVELPGAEMGKVVVRFPPEASGFLHIGHAKAALLNQHYQKMFQGKLIMRFDDTNPAKEKVDFEEVILGDLEMLKVKPDQFTYTSNYFEKMLQLCEQMIKEGKAYVDDTDTETMRDERMKRIESKNRSNTVQKNLQLWEEMKKGSSAGQKCCVRAKIDMNSHNGCMRDPTIYRCKDEPHPRHGDKYKVYPTYDFACPIVDSLEGVTHALRTTEYHDRDDQFFWFIDALGLRKPFIYEYSRLNLTNTVLSKRKLTWFVDEGHVDGWDDPRFPTVRGVLRRGMTVEGLREFIIAQGSSRSVVMMQWDKIWAFNRQVIDPIAPRHTGLVKDSLVTVNVKDASVNMTLCEAHPKNPDVGKRTVWRGPKLLVERDDADLFKEGENVTFVNWGNLKITKITRKNGKIESIDASMNLEDKNFKTTLKVTWLTENEQCELTPVSAFYYDHIISKAIISPDEDFKNFLGKDTKIKVDIIGDGDLKKLKKGDIIQLQRKGFFICDVPYEARNPHTCKETPLVLIDIPDGKTKEMPTAKNPTAKQEPAKEKTAPVDSKPSTSSSLADIDSAITAQGNKIRDLKSAKAGKDVIEKEVKQLLAFKGEFKTVSGKDWDPKGNNVPATNSSTTPVGRTLENIDADITAQGNKIRDLKASKAGKDVIDKEVKQLIALKAEFKTASGKDWDPKGNNVPAEEKTVTATKTWVCGNEKENELKTKIEEQGNKVRQLKEAKASKEQIDAEVKNLLGLKAQYKEATGQDYVAPGSASSGKKDKQQAKKAPVEEKPVTCTKTWVCGNEKENELKTKIEEQGNKVRQLKETKASKEQIDAEVKNLLGLKAQYKEATGQDYVAPGSSASSGKKDKQPNKAPVQEKPVTCTETWVCGNEKENELKTKIEEQGNKVRQLKEAKASKEQIDSEVKNLLGLKVQYKEATGQDYVAPGSGNAASGKKDKQQAKKAPPPQKQQQPEQAKGDSTSGVKKQTKLGIDTKKSEDLSDWFYQVNTKGEMIEYYDVSGCYIFRPWSYAIWDSIREWFDGEIKKLGVQNCYFPMFVSHAALEKEKNHIADFAPEVAWVTKSGDTELAEPIAIRPTSETVMYPSYAKWVQSYRDLPIKLNQWNNVVRWEFKNPQPFIRTREFLWQEGHTAFATQKEAEDEVMQILDLYSKVYTDLLAIPVVPGRKTEKEKFPGGDYTTTVEAFISASGRGLQGATSHHLGQNFSKMFDIVFEHPETREKQYAYQNSWGLSTRTIGAMVMVHGDDQGLVLPPRVAQVQIVIVVCGVTVNTTEAEKATLISECEEYEKRLCQAQIRAKADLRDNYSPGWKFNHWELKGVPVRIEVGPRDMKDEQYVAVIRHNGQKATYKKESLEKDMQKMLVDVHNSMYQKAKSELDSSIIITESWTEFTTELDKKKIIMSPYCGVIECEENIKKDSAREEADPGQPSMGAKSLCIPFKQPKELQPNTKCVHPKCGQKAKFYTLFGRSY